MINAHSKFVSLFTAIICAVAMSCNCVVMAHSLQYEKASDLSMADCHDKKQETPESELPCDADCSECDKSYLKTDKQESHIFFNSLDFAARDLRVKAFYKIAYPPFSSPPRRTLITDHTLLLI